MEVKSNRKVVSLLVVIIVLLVCCVGLLGYKLYFSDNKDDVNNNQNQVNDNSSQNQDNNTPVENDEEDLEEDNYETITLDSVKKVLSGNLDSNAKRITPKITDNELKKDFKNLDKSNNNYKIVASCTYYNKSAKFCETYKVTVNSTIEYKLSLPGCTQIGELYVYNNYLVLVVDEGCSGSTKVTIYDSNNKSVYSNSKIYSLIYDVNDENENDIIIKPTINEGKLYFAEDTATEDTMNLISIDLSKSTIKAKVSGQFTATHVH